MIQFAEPAQYQNFNLYIDEDNLYSGITPRLSTLLLLELEKSCRNFNK